LKIDISLNKIGIPEKDYLYTEISQIPNSGNGLFTAIDIYKDEVIAIFKGEILTDLEARIRSLRGEDKYFINLLNGTIMDSMHTKCFAKFANDANGSSAINLKNNAKITLNDFNLVCIMATRKIKSGEELLCSYGKKYWKSKG